MQQVNLYVEELRPRREWLPARQIGLGAAALVVLLALVQLAIDWQARQAQAQQQHWQSQMNSLQDRYQTLVSQVEALQIDPALQLENQHLQDQLETRRDLLGSLLQGGSASAVERFSSILEGLARQHVEAVWLSGIDIGDGGHSLVLQGMLTQPAQLPVYLQRLSQEASFTGRQFNLFELKEPDEDKRWLSFRIATQEANDSVKTGGQP